MLVGYARVSTTEQVLDLQTDALVSAGCKKIFSDTISGTKSDRPGLTQALEFCREGDTFVVWKLDRLGRSLKHLIETVEDLKNRGIGFKSIQEAIDTSTSTGKLYFHVFCALAEFERDLIRERTLAGLEAARTRGRKGGRRRVISERKIQAAVELALDKNRTVGEICETLGINTGSYYRYIYPRLKQQQKQTV
jgi:DNA invertase Pin-like site-specific DNA recombinase